MNNEIKEILNGFKEVLDNPTTTDEGCDGRIIEINRSYDLDFDEIKVLLDYITNLQEKYEQLRTELNSKNNIINELEEYLIEQSEKSWDDNGAYDDVLDKLEELKENNNAIKN